MFCSTILGRRLYSNLLLERSRACLTRILSGPCEFGAYDLGKYRDRDPALADFELAQRHLEAEVRTCELDKKTNPLGRLSINDLGDVQRDADDAILERGSLELACILFLYLSSTLHVR